MGDRYRYGTRRGSPPLYNPARASLPINLAYPEQQPHLHVVPSSRREIIPPTRSSNTGSSVSNAGTVTTTYKVTTEPPKHGSHVRDGSRTRRSTIGDHNRPTIVTTGRTHRPVVHSAVERPGSPMKNPYRSSEEEYIVTPATSSRHSGHHHHKKHYSATMDNADMNRLAREREDSRLRVVPVRDPTYRARTRPVYSGTVVRHADTVADDYGDNGYGYTNPQDLVRYDLDRGTQPTTVVHRSRRDSFDGGRTARPSSITGYNDIVPRSYDTRERGPPPSMRGFDKIRAPPYDQASVRMPRAPSPGNSMAPIEPVARPPPFEPVEPMRRSSSTRNRPTSYHDRDRPRGPREDYYEVRDDDRPHRHESWDDRVESRGFGIRGDRPETRTAPRVERPAERIEHLESRTGARSEYSEYPESRSTIRPERSERVERSERSERTDRGDDGDHKEHKSRDALATGLSIAGAALGINAVKNANRQNDRRDSDSDEREERRRRDHDDEPRRRRERDEREHVDLGGRDPKERRHRDDDLPSQSRDSPPLRDSKDAGPRGKDVKERSPTIDLGGRDPKERQAPREERDEERHDRHRQRSEAALIGTAIDSSDTGSDDAKPRTRRETRPRGNSNAAAAVGATAGAAMAAAPSTAPAFNPKDTMDLKALKEALNAKDNAKDAAAKAAPPKEPSRTPRHSTTKDSGEVAKIREDLKPERGRDPLAPNDNRQLRVVSPPREKSEDKPVKGILRQPREKFPEDPAPIREGVAPLKDAKKDGIPPDARWTKISRKLVNPEALEAGKERFEAREDFVIVLRVLSRDEVQGYAEVTQRIRAAREELEEIEAADRRRARRERHERHKRERNGEVQREHGTERRRRRDRDRDQDRDRDHDHRDRSVSESDTTDDEYDDGDRVSDKPKMLEAPKKRATFEDAMMTGGLGGDIASSSGGMGSLREDPGKPGVYSGYVRNPPLPKQ